MDSSTKFRVVIDTNIFVSAFLGSNNAQAIIHLWEQGIFILLMSPYLSSEVLLTLERFDFPETEINYLKKILSEETEKMIPRPEVTICRDKKDNYILDLCLIGKADLLITGDKDLLTLKSFKTTKIVMAKKFLSIIS